MQDIKVLLKQFIIGLFLIISTKHKKYLKFLGDLCLSLQRHITHVVVGKIVIDQVELKMIMTDVIPFGKIQPIIINIQHDICVLVEFIYSEGRI